MKEQLKAPKIELSDEEIASVSDAEFKTLVIRMLTEMVEYGHLKEGKLFLRITTSGSYKYDRYYYNYINNHLIMHGL